MPKAIVVGAGIGGLALAIRLQSAGVDVTVLEKRDKAGGRAYVFEQDGYRFDAGPTVITDPNCLEELFALSGRRLSDYCELLPINPFYKLLWPDGVVFDYVNNQEELDRQIARLSPRDVGGYRRFLEYSRAAYKEGYLKLGHVAFVDAASMIRAAPKLVQMQAWRSVYSIVSKFVKEPHLREALSFHTLLVGGSPFASSSIYTLIHALEREGGVWFARGGTGALISAMVRLLEDLGGRLRTQVEVSEILTSSDRVVGVKNRAGDVFDADLVVSNGDVMHTYRDLLPRHRRGREMSRSLSGRRFSMSLFVVYFGLKRPPDPALAHHTIVFGPHFKPLIDAVRGAAPLRSDFSLYLHAPSVTDPSLAPPGHSAFYALSPVPNLGRAIDWKKEGPGYAERILDELQARVLPDLRKDLDTLRIFTPEDFRDELNAHLGSAFSLEPILTQSAYFRVHNRDPILRNLYFVGAGTHPGAGVPGVVGSAKATARLILNDVPAAMAA